GGLAFVRQMPELLSVPRATVAHPRVVLVTNAPTAVAAFDDVYEPSFVTRVAIVVARKKVAVFVERQLLRIAQAVSGDLEVGAGRFAAQHRPGVGKRQRLAFRGLHIQAAVADAEIEQAVWSHP